MIFTTKFLIRILINILIGIFLIWIWLKFVNISQILSNLGKVSLLSIIPILFFNFLSAILRALRLKIFLSDPDSVGAEIQKIKLLDLFFLNGVALMLNFFIPIRAGEVAKGFYLNTRYKLQIGKAIIWVFMDRFVDFLVVLLVAALLLMIVPTSLNITVIKIIIVILILVLAITYLAVFQLDFSKKLVRFLTPLFIERHIKIYFTRFSNFILQAFSILNRHPKDLLLMSVITVLAYASDASIWYFTFKALNSSQEFLKMYLGQLLSALTYLIPAAPGYVGSAEASGLLILSGVFGINPNLASSMIVLFHIISVVFILIFGLISVSFLKLDLGLIFRKVFKKDEY